MYCNLYMCFNTFDTRLTQRLVFFLSHNSQRVDTKSPSYPPCFHSFLSFMSFPESYISLPTPNSVFFTVLFIFDKYLPVKVGGKPTVCTLSLSLSLSLRKLLSIPRPVYLFHAITPPNIFHFKRVFTVLYAKMFLFITPFHTIAPHISLFNATPQPCIQLILAGGSSTSVVAMLDLVVSLPCHASEPLAAG